MARYDGSRVQHFEYELVLPDAGVRRIEARLSGKTTGGFVLTVRDVTERATMMNALRASEEKFRRLFETSPVAMSLALEEGTFLDANQAWCDIMGYRRDEVTSLTFQAITPPDFEQTTDARIREIAARGQYGPFDKEYFHRSGRRIPVRVSGTVLTDAQGLRFVWSIVTDITEQKESEERLVVAREKALEAARMKTQFLANMSHEIRTPMNAILGMTELLSDTPLDKNQLDCVETVRLSGDLLLAIINEYPRFLEIESGLNDSRGRAVRPAHMH